MMTDPRPTAPEPRPTFNDKTGEWWFAGRCYGHDGPRALYAYIDTLIAARDMALRQAEQAAWERGELKQMVELAHDQVTRQHEMIRRREQERDEAARRAEAYRAVAVHASLYHFYDDAPSLTVEQVAANLDAAPSALADVDEQAQRVMNQPPPHGAQGGES
jgi:hypothetical protein